jgi:hypothetical protein
LEKKEMLKRFTLIIAIGFSGLVYSQKIEGMELGLDGFFGASTMGGSFGFGPKLGFRMNENLILGPSFRFQRTWSKNNFTGQEFSFNNYGGGIFIHGRYKNTVYGGIEAEVMRTANLFIDTSAVFKRVVPTVFLCAGFSKEFNEKIRLNVGLYYDIINSLNSPFRTSYVMTIKNPETGQIVRYIPMIYRISIFIPLGKN